MPEPIEPNLVDVGRAAEAQAAEYLENAGYTIVTRRYKSRHGELDIVALDSEVLVFVEVKTRRTPGFRPENELGKKKLEALQHATAKYVAEMEQQNRQVRIDLIAIDADGLRHYKDILG